jgi:hypothetical protein
VEFLNISQPYRPPWSVKGIAFSFYIIANFKRTKVKYASRQVKRRIRTEKKEK